MPVQTLQDLYVKELRDLYGAERLLLRQIPEMMETAGIPELRKALSHHMEEIRGQLQRLEKIFQLHGEKPDVKRPAIVEAILREATEDAEDAATPILKDAVIVASLQQVKHYEIAAYGTLKSYAVQLGHREAAKILDATLKEEKETDERLTALALEHLRVETHAL